MVTTASPRGDYTAQALAADPAMDKELADMLGPVPLRRR
jgi:hypothetical protein